MDPLLVVSPHLDDAVLSAGEALAGWTGPTVVLSILAGLPPHPVVTTFDANCGFASSTDSTIARWHEDDRALRRVGATALRAPFLDNQYGDRPTAWDVAAMILLAVDAIHPVAMLGPMGLAHPDHELIGDAFLSAALQAPCVPWLYEDIPARVELPLTVPPRLEALEAAGWTPHLSHLASGPLDAKKAAVAAYRSQLWALDERVLYVPERLWRIER